MMTELSLHVLDIAQNSIQAGASLVEITAARTDEPARLTLAIRDNGRGMTADQARRVVDPFYTTRTTRKVGLGVPFFKLSAELTGGSFSIESEPGKGTVVAARYHADSIDMLPVGDMAATMTSLVSVNPDVDFTYTYRVNGEAFTMDTREIRGVLAGFPLNAAEVLGFIRDLITENTAELDRKNDAKDGIKL